MSSGSANATRKLQMASQFKAWPHCLEERFLVLASLGTVSQSANHHSINDAPIPLSRIGCLALHTAWS